MALVSPSWPHQLSTVSAGNTSTIHILKLLDLIARFMVSRSLNITLQTEVSLSIAQVVGHWKY